MVHCTVCKQCRIVYGDDYHWTCGRCQLCMDGENEKCYTCDGVSEQYEPDEETLLRRDAVDRYLEGYNDFED